MMDSSSILIHSGMYHTILCPIASPTSQGKSNLANKHSGHYRPQTANFRRFVRALEDQNVDMSHISITKSYAVLLGTEGYGKLKKEKQKLHDTMDSLKAKYINREEDSEHPENGKGLAIRTKTREILGGAP